MEVSKTKVSKVFIDTHEKEAAITEATNILNQQKTSPRQINLSLRKLKSKSRVIKLRKLEMEYTVPYQPKGQYKLMIQKQPGAKDFHYIIKINGKKVADFKLDQDKEFRFNI